MHQQRAASAVNNTFYEYVFLASYKENQLTLCLSNAGLKNITSSNVTEENKTALGENEWRLSDHYNGFELWVCYTPFYKQIIPLQQSYKIHQTLCSEDFTHQAFSPAKVAN